MEWNGTVWFGAVRQGFHNLCMLIWTTALALACPRYTQYLSFEFEPPLDTSTLPELCNHSFVLLPELRGLLLKLPLLARRIKAAGSTMGPNKNQPASTEERRHPRPHKNATAAATIDAREKDAVEATLGVR